VTIGYRQTSVCKTKTGVQVPHVLTGGRPQASEITWYIASTAPTYKKNA